MVSERVEISFAISCAAPSFAVALVVAYTIRRWPSSISNMQQVCATNLVTNLRCGWTSYWLVLWVQKGSVRIRVEDRDP